jgi:hypothetical protein
VKQLGKDEIEQCPKLVEVVLNRRSSQQEPKAAVELLQRLEELHKHAVNEGYLYVTRQLEDLPASSRS